MGSVIAVLEGRTLRSHCVSASLQPLNISTALYIESIYLDVIYCDTPAAATPDERGSWLLTVKKVWRTPQ